MGRNQSPPSPSHAPSVRVIRPTVRKPQTSRGQQLRAASSMDNMYDDSERASPLPRPPSRTGTSASSGVPRPSSRSAMRPSSRTGMRPERKASGQASRSGRLSRSAQPSPSQR